MLELKNIDVIFNKGTALSRTILKNINLCVEDGEFVVIVGGNGAGKSTLFNVIAGVLLPTKGKIFLDNKDITNIPQYRRSAYVSRVVQDTKVGTMPDLTIFENFSFAYMRGGRRKLMPYRTSDRLKMFLSKLELLGIGLEERINDPVGSLSGGQRQAVSLLMSVLSGSKILLLDEITAALDPKIANSMMVLADKIIRSENRTTLMITHNMSHAIKYGDRTLLISNGSIKKEFDKESKENLTPQSMAVFFQ